MVSQPNQQTTLESTVVVASANPTMFACFFCLLVCLFVRNRLHSFVVEVLMSVAGRLGFKSLLSHTSDLEYNPFATLPGTWHYGVSAWTGWPSVCVVTG